MASNDKEQKHYQELNVEASKMASQSQKIVSQHTIQYEKKLSFKAIDISTFLNNFNRNNINFVPGSPYQPFSYQVERVFPSLNFFKSKVKIAHFSLTVSVLKVNQTNILANFGGKQSNFGCIYFLKSNQQRLCVKSFAFKSHEIFKKLFPRVIKQWVIHRICSALECGPFISNAFGFDILVFDDCIQYATEEGKEMLGFSSVEAAHLKQQMAIMHAFRIMHLDIKPQNTIFSPHFRKPVFIDFGFSEIIEEELGFKTLITFRGTPNYCSPQMLAIMLQTQGYIDLYFNDAFSLEQTLSVRKKIVSVVQLEEEESEDHSRMPLFPIYNFQYHYLQSNAIKARQVMQKCIQFDEKTIIKTILIYIKTTCRSVFLREFFEKDLGKYRNIVEYREIQEEIKRNANKFFYKSNVNEFKNIQDESNIFEISSFAVGELFQSYHHYFRIILELCQLEAETAVNFVSIAFECIRFDVKNLQVFEKKQIADKMNLLLIVYLQADRRQFEQKEDKQISQKEELFLKQIKVMLKLVFYFCLSNPSPWVKKHIFDVCQQMIILNINFQENIAQLAIYANQVYKQPKEEALAIFQYSRLITAIELVDFQQTYNFQELLHKFNQQVTYWLSRYYQSSALSEDRELLAIKNLLKLLQNEMTNNIKYPIEVEQANLKHIQNTEIRKYLLLFLMKKKIDHFMDTMSSQQILGIVQFSKCSSDLQKLDLFSSTIVTIRILIEIHNFAGAQAYYNYISSIINCDTIVKRLKIHKKQIQYSPDIHFLKNRMRIALKAFRKSTQFEGIQFQLLQMFLIFQRMKMPISELRDDFLQLYVLYRRQNKQRIQRETKKCIMIQQFLRSFYYIQLQYQFFCFSDKCRDVFLFNLDKFQKDYYRLAELQPSPRPQDQLMLTYTSYKMHFYRFHYYLYLQEPQKCIICLNQIQLLLQCLHLNSLLLDIVKLEIAITVNWKQQQAVSKATYKLYNICCQINFKSFYLIPRNSNDTYTSLVVFQYSNEPLFYTFLSELTLFLVEHPIECYCQSLLLAIDKFIKFHPQRGYSIHYSKFIGQNNQKLKANPYLLIFYAYSLRNESTETKLKLYKRIILHCDRLSSYAKKKVLERCMDVYFEYLNHENRQQKLFNFKMMKYFINKKKRKRIFQHSVVLRYWPNKKYQTFKEKLNIFRSYLA